MKPFLQFFKENVNYNLDDFPDKWKAAVSSSEELRVGLSLMREISRLFPQGEIYIVGGVPRDLLMGNDIDDVDMATNIPFEGLSKHFELRNISKNDSQPVYTILHKNYAFDLAKFREDSQGEDGRQNNVSREIDSFETDSKRRDITINSFGLDHTGRIVDYQGGLKDLQDKVIRAVGDAKARFKEDATRILRVFRFAAKMDFEIEATTAQAARELKGLLQDPTMISQESISQEMFKAAKSGPTLSNFLQKLQDADILNIVLPEFLHMDGMTHNPTHHPEGGSTVLGHIHECLKVSPYKDPVINLAVMLHDFGKASTKGEKNGHSTYYGHEAAGVPIVENIFKRMRFATLSQHDKKNILMAVEKHMLIHKLMELNPKTISKLVLDPSWETVKAVGYCDEASRGPSHFNPKEFEEKIQYAESKAKSLGANPDELRKRIKQYINGNTLMEWYPVLQKDKTKMKDLMEKLQEFIINKLDKGEEPTEQELYQLGLQIMSR